MTSDTCELRRLAVTFALVTAGLVSGISLSLFARLRGRNVKIAIVYVESTLALEENFASDCRAELRNTIDADVAVFWLEVFGGHAEKRVDFMLGSLSDFPGASVCFPPLISGRSPNGRRRPPTVPPRYDAKVSA